MKKPGLKKLLVIAVILLTALGAGGAFLLKKLLHLDTYKAQIAAAVETSLNRKLTYEKGDFSFRFGPAFTFTKVVLKEKDGLTNFAAADRLTFTVALLPLLEKKVVLKEIHLDRPMVELSRDPSGALNIADLLAEKKEETPLHVKGVRIKGGFIRFTDRFVSNPPLTTVLEETDLNLSDIRRGKQCRFKFAAFIREGGARGVVSFAGSADIAAKGKPLADTAVKGSLLLKNLDAGPWWPYYSRYAPFQKIWGRMDTETRFKGKLSAFSAEGTVKVSGLRFHYPGIFHAPLTPKEVRFKYAMTLSPKDISVQSLDLNVDGLNVKGRCDIRDIDTKDPRITAKAATSRFRLEEFGDYIPYGVIAKDTSEFIEKHIKGGTYKLDEGKLDGRVSQILHMEKGENYNILYIRGTVDKGLLTFGPQVPAFNNVKGNLAMQGKDFIMTAMSGNFGASPFTLEGRITDYPMETPSAYPFTMTMNPRQPEAAWLCRQGKTGRVGFMGNSTLRLAGNGFTTGYNLAGEWELTPASYIYPDIVTKPAGKTNHISFKGSINKEEARIQSLRFDLAPLSLSVSGAYRFTGKERLSLSIKSNQFQLQDVSSMSPLLRKYAPRGKAAASVQGEGTAKDDFKLSWSGNVAFDKVSFKPSESIKPISNLSGVLRFTGDSLETSNLSGRLGNSMIYGKGALTDFANPSFSLTFSSPLLYLSDLGMHAAGEDMKVQKAHGDISLKNGNLHIGALSIQLNRSILNIAGTVRDIRNPKADITLNSPHLETDDIMSLANLQREGKAGEAQPKVSLKATVTADTGKIKNLPYKKLHSSLTMDNKILYLQPMEFQALGGKVSAKGRVDFGVEKGPRCQMSFSTGNISTPQLLKFAGVEKELITGALSMNGDLIAKGENWDDIKRTALGNIRINLNEGTIKKFSVLSKIFSILNLSQLLKLQLPDMVANGMPYNEIRGSISLQDGILSTRDMFVDSNAMNISAVGKADLVKEELDMTIGVQPLQTVDKVVSHIPIVGWILTGKNKTLVTTYFEAKGKWDDPTVAAIPVKSMTKGVLDIFKRIFQLPGKLITDTGEVILGN